MPPASPTAAPPEIEAFLEGLAESKVLDADRARGAWDDYQLEQPSSGLAGFAEYLTRREVLTRYQAERAVAGESDGLQIGPYLLLEPIGSERFGPDFLALHRGDRRRFTVKVLPLRSLWRVHQAKRLTNDFRALPVHRTIVPLVEIDTANGSHYLSWLHAEGETLAELLRRAGPFKPRAACRVFAAAAEGLALCHAAGFCHGMLTPANILFDGKILDWGLGHLLAENLDDESMFDTITTANSASETMDYGAPETIADPAVRTAAADAYSFGCVLYTVLAGSPPFSDGNAVDKMIAHRTRMPTPIRDLNPAIPASLDALVFALLRKSPEGRPGLRELKESLESLAAGLPLEAPATTPSDALALDFGRIESAKSAPYKASQIFQSSEGLIDFDFPGEVRCAETPPAFHETPPPVRLAPVKPLTADRDGSVPVLLLPEPSLRRPPNPTPFPLPPRKNWEPPPAPVNWVSAGAKCETRAERPPVTLPPPPKFESAVGRGVRKQLLFWKAASDTVQLSVFGAPEIAVGQRVNFLVYAHSPETYSDIVTLCRALRPDSELLGAGYLDVPVTRGIDVNLHLALTYAGVAKSLVKFTWIGQTQPRTFEVFVPWESPAGLASGVVTAGIDKAMVASVPLHFVIPPRQA